jgi:multidrug efflux pump subunit AcrB
MNALIRFSLRNWHAVIVFAATLVVVGGLMLTRTPFDILPAYNKPAVQVLTFYGGMPASNVEKDITARMERWTGQAAGTERQESRSITGCSIIRNIYFDNIDPNGALTQVNSLASAAIPNLPPGTLPPVILPYDPTGTTPVCLVALDWPNPPGEYGDKQVESILYDVGRYEVRNFIMGEPGTNAPVVYGGRVRAVLAYMDRSRMQARNLAPVDLMNALDRFNLFLPTGDAKFGKTDYALDSNSMYELVQRMRDIPVKTEDGKTVFLGEVADPQDTSFIQTNMVRVNGRRQVYIPVYRQQGSSTLGVVDALRDSLPEMQQKLSRSDINLKLVMDQSVYVRDAIDSLAEEGALGAILCSLVILVFLGEWRMTLIAVCTIPFAVLSAVIWLNVCHQTINVMTLAGLALAIGPLVDSAIICLENTHRHLGLGAKPKEAAFFGASEVAMPELVAMCCTLLVLAPLALMPGTGKFLFLPMALAVGFAMVTAYILSRSFVPAMCGLFLKGHAPRPGPEHHDRDWGDRSEHENPPPRGWLGRAFDRWESLLNRCIAGYVRLLDRILRRRGLVLAGTGVLLVAAVAGVGSQLRREFFPEVDAGAFEIYARARAGTRIEETERRIAKVEKVVRDTTGNDVSDIISEIGVVADWSAAYTPNAGPMDAVVKVQLKPERAKSAQQYVALLRKAFKADPDPDVSQLEVAFNAGGMIRSAMNEGRSTPINVRITGKDTEKAYQVAEAIKGEVEHLSGVVDCRILQRLDYPEYVVDVDQAKAADLGLTQRDVMENLIASLNSSIQFNKHNFWIDPVTHNQYYVGVQYPEEDISSLDTLLDVVITSTAQHRSIPLRNVATVRKAEVPAEVTHTKLQPTINLTMGVEGRDLGHVSDDVARVIGKYGKSTGTARWQPYDPTSKSHKLLEGSAITLSGEYTRMQDTFSNMGLGLVLASLLVYFLMVALFRSWLSPLVILSAVPVGLIGVVLMLFVTRTAINVQSLLGVIFMVGIVVSNTVLLVDFAQHLRRHEGLTPTEAIRKAASIRVRPVLMTALAALFALLPMAIGLGRGSEANAPLGRAVIGGLLAGLVTTLFVVPSLFSLVVRGPLRAEEDDIPTTPRRPVAPPSTDIVSAGNLPPRLAGPGGAST